MPADPTVEDWEINRVSAEEVEALRRSLTSVAPVVEEMPPADDATATQFPPAVLTPAIAPLLEATSPCEARPDPHHQSEDLRQIVAAFILLVGCVCR